MDLGGGKGELIKQVYMRNKAQISNAQLLVVDMPESFVGLLGTHEKIEFVDGDMVKGPILPADCYLVKHIFEGFDDAITLAVMKNISASILPNGRMMIVEYTILPPGQSSFGNLLDVHMIVFGGHTTPLRTTNNLLTVTTPTTTIPLRVGGKSRTLADLKVLLSQVGFEVVRYVPSEMGIVLTECKKI